MKKGSRPDTEEKKAKARKRAEVIVKARSGLVTVTAAAKELGVSRKTYYEWDKKGLEGMVEALTDSPSGRPLTPQDAEKEELKRQLQETRRELELLKTKMRIREIMEEPAPETGAGSKKKERSEKRKGEGDGGDDSNMPQHDSEHVSGDLPGGESALSEPDAVEEKDACERGTDPDAGPEKSGAA